MADTAAGAGNGSFLERMKSFLEFARKRIDPDPEMVEKAFKIRRVGDLRIRRWIADKPDISANELCRLLVPGTDRPLFDELAEEAGLFSPFELSFDWDPFCDEMTFFREGILLAETVDPDILLSCLKNFLRESEETAAPAPSGPKEKPEDSAEKRYDHARSLIERIEEIRAVPEWVRKMQSLFTIPDIRNTDLADMLRLDPQLTEQVVRLINVFHCGLSATVESLHRALLILGYPPVMRLLPVAALVRLLGKEQPDIDYDLRGHWGHTLWVAHAASLLTEEEGEKVYEEFFTAGFLHDVGRLVTYRHLRPLMRKVLLNARSGVSYEEVERRFLKTDHSALGQALCDKWEFPEYVGKAARYHHSPPETLVGKEIPRHALTVAALCRLSRRQDDAELEKWCGLLDVTPARFAEISSRASDLAISSLRDVYIAD